MTFNSVFCEGYFIYAADGGDLYFVDTEEWILWDVLMPGLRDEPDALEKYILPNVLDNLSEMLWTKANIH